MKDKTDLKLAKTRGSKPQRKSVKMRSNVILTFNTASEEFDETQEIFNIYLRIRENETSSLDFLNRELFPKIVEKCTAVSRDPGDLIKISTASDWGLFNQATGLPSLCDVSHPCKWYFGYDRPDMDLWERDLMVRHGFGNNVSVKELFQPEYFEVLEQFITKSQSA